MNQLDLTKNGGLKFTQQILEFMQSSYTDTIMALARAFGDKVILTGCVITGGSISDGWLLLDGVPTKFIGGALDTKIVVNVTTEDVVFKNGIAQPVKQFVTATCAGFGGFDFSQLKRAVPFNATDKAKYDSMWITGDVKEIDCDNTYLTTYFDTTGLGRLERLGWAICNGNNGTRNRAGRVSVGYDGGTIDPNNNVWDVAYNNLGAIGGKKRHLLTKAESGLPDHSHNYGLGGATASGGGNNFAKLDSDPKDRTTSIVGADASQAHENRQPFIVTLFIQKI